MNDCSIFNFGILKRPPSIIMRGRKNFIRIPLNLYERNISFPFIIARLRPIAPISSMRLNMASTTPNTMGSAGWIFTSPTDGIYQNKKPADNDKCAEREETKEYHFSGLIRDALRAPC